MRILSLLVIALPLMAQNDPAPPDRGPELIIVGPVLTLDSARPRARGLVVRNGLIAAVTSADAARAMAGPGTRVIEVPATGAVLPGIVDSHAHLAGVGRARRTLDLRGARTPEEVAERVRGALTDLPEGTWVVGRGWNQELWPNKRLPDRSVLDAVAKKHPCALERVDGHAQWVNSLALELAGITADAPSPQGGEIIKDASGRPTGVLVDTATGMVERLLPSEDDPNELERDLLAGQDEAFRLGITTFVDAGVSPAGLVKLNELYAAGKMRMRVHAMLSVRTEQDLKRVIAGTPIKSLHQDRVAVRAIKLYADGALGSRGAWLLEPYADRAEHSGLNVLTPAFIEQVAKAALDRGYQVCTHAIGDRGVRETLNAYERAFKAAQPHQVANHRFRIEHAQIVHPRDIPRFAKLGVFPSMQGCHCTSDGPWVPDRLGQARTRGGAYVWRSFLEAGCIIPNGTDAPVESLSPWRNLFSSITRFMEMDDQRHEAFYPRQRMNRLEALLSMTYWGATGAFCEDRRGRIRPGYQADLVILNRDPMTCSVWHLGRAAPLFTIVAGEIVYEKK
ncbi:MAG: amidohydrolase [Phycisphaeraceae bacterium]|nr:amidohydrolase [Phycisphaeraceae bacterium]